MVKYDSLEEFKKMPSLKLQELYDVKGKVCFVSGGSRGIGLMIAKALYENGAKVYVCSRKKDVCDEIVAALNKLPGGEAVSLPGDLASDKNCRDIAAMVKEDKLDVLVNNAGATWGASFDDFPESAWEKIMTLNVSSIFHLTRAFRPKLAAASKGNLDPSHVINIGSVGGALASPFDNNYSYLASKAAVEHLTRVLAAQLLSDHINVNCIAPAAFPSKMTFDYQFSSEHSTEMSAKSHPVGRNGNESDMAGLTLFLSSRASAFITGQTIYLDGGMTTIRTRL